MGGLAFEIAVVEDGCGGVGDGIGDGGNEEGEGG